MKKFITKFSTTSEYENATLELPNVSLIEDDMEVKYSPYVRDYSKEYFTTVALENGTISFDYWPTLSTTSARYMEYSTDSGETWTMTNNIDNQSVTITVNVSDGDVILWRGDNDVLGFYDEYDCEANVGSFFSSTCEFNVSGNVMSLLYTDNFANETDLTGKDIVFCNLFSDYNGNKECLVTDAANLILPATTLAIWCYYNMFCNCTSLTTPPELPATTLADHCYSFMFKGCTSLTTAPELPATTVAGSCYGSMFRDCTSLTTAPVLPATTLGTWCYAAMFYGCTSITTAPELPATTLANDCYRSMFYRCTNLTTAPELPATTLTSYCYNAMFQGCTSLNYIKMLATNISATNCLQNWVSGVASTGTFVKNSAATWTTTGVNGIPTGWTVETA